MQVLATACEDDALSAFCATYTVVDLSAFDTLLQKASCKACSGNLCIKKGEWSSCDCTVTTAAM